MVFPHLIPGMDESKDSPINSRLQRLERPRLALEEAWLGFEERVLWRLGDGLRALLGKLGSLRRRSRSGAGPELDAIWRPFESFAWFLREEVLWPLIDRFSALDTRGRIATSGGVALAAGIGLAALVLAVSGGSASSAPTASAPIAIVKSAAAPTSAPAVKVPAPAVAKPKTPPAPTLHGSTPVFTPPKRDAKAADGLTGGVAASPKKDANAKAPAPTNAPAATAEIGATPAATAAASASTDTRTAMATKDPSSHSTSGGATQLDGPPAGPKAIKVARDFAGAFVVYETGGIDSRVREAFGNSATPALSHSLLKRPPRLPADVKVPRAKVVNIVPGPSQGKVFTVSVSLLRVGVTSELRLEMEQRKHDGWQVTNVLG
jgi:hypothetical protein